MVRFMYAWAVYTWGGLHRYFGHHSNLRSEYENAIHYFRRAYEIDPSFVGARAARGALLWRELGRTKEALQEFDTVLKQEPNHVAALFNRAMALQENGRYREAVRDLETYLKIANDDPYRGEASRLVLLLRDSLPEGQAF